MSAKHVAIIPARGGSKGVPNKNIIPLGGKPAIAWTIEAALACSQIARVIVSTDSLDIAAVSRQYGAEVPFLRPAELARDDTPGLAPIIHATKWLITQEDYAPDYILCLQPTSPLRQTEDIAQAIDLTTQKEIDSVVSVTAVSKHPYWMKQIDDTGLMQDFITQKQPITRRQELPQVYALNGAIYLVQTDVLLERESFYTENTLAYIMPQERSLDIDTPWDVHLVDLILKDKAGHADH